MAAPCATPDTTATRTLAKARVLNHMIFLPSESVTHWSTLSSGCPISSSRQAVWHSSCIPFNRVWPIAQRGANVFPQPGEHSPKEDNHEGLLDVSHVLHFCRRRPHRGLRDDGDGAGCHGVHG